MGKVWKSIFDDIFWLGKSDGFGYMAYAAHRDAEISGEVRRLQTIFCAKWQNFCSTLFWFIQVRKLGNIRCFLWEKTWYRMEFTISVHVWIETCRKYKWNGSCVIVLRLRSRDYILCFVGCRGVQNRKPQKIYRNVLSILFQRKAIPPLQWIGKA